MLDGMVCVLKMMFVIDENMEFLILVELLRLIVEVSHEGVVLVVVVEV